MLTATALLAASFSSVGGVPLGRGGYQPIHQRWNHPVAEQVKQLNWRLDLSEAQRTAAQAILEQRQGQFRRVYGDHSLAASDRALAVRALNEQAVAQIRALLTAEQLRRFQLPRLPGVSENVE